MTPTQRYAYGMRLRLLRRYTRRWLAQACDPQRRQELETRLMQAEAELAALARCPRTDVEQKGIAA